MEWIAFCCIYHIVQKIRHIHTLALDLALVEVGELAQIVQKRGETFLGTFGIFGGADALVLRLRLLQVDQCSAQPGQRVFHLVVQPPQESPAPQLRLVECVFDQPPCPAFRPPGAHPERQQEQSEQKSRHERHHTHIDLEDKYGDWIPHLRRGKRDNGSDEKR